MKTIYWAGALLVIAAAQAAAQTYPTRPVRLVIGAGPVSASGAVAGAIAPALSDLWKQQVVIEPRPGAGGAAAGEIVAKATPDGHTLLMCTIASHALGPTLNKKHPYNHIKDFAPVSRVATTPNVMVVNPSVPAKSVKEFIAYAKANAGKVQYSSGGVGATNHLSMELFRSMTGISVVHVPITGDRVTSDEVISGRTAVAITNLPSVLPQVKDGKLRALGVAAAKRHPLLPDVPTLIESGLAGFEVGVWSGICVPAKVAKPIITKLNADVVKVLNMPETRKRLAERGADAVTSTPDEFAKFIKAETARWAKVAKSAGIEPK